MKNEIKVNRNNKALPNKVVAEPITGKADKTHKRIIESEAIKRLFLYSCIVI